jgi:hypothetical protein
MTSSDSTRLNDRDTVPTMRLTPRPGDDIQSSTEPKGERHGSTDQKEG